MSRRKTPRRTPNKRKDRAEDDEEEEEEKKLVAVSEDGDEQVSVSKKELEILRTTAAEWGKAEVSKSVCCSHGILC